MGRGCHAHRQYEDWGRARADVDPEVADERRRRHFIDDASRFGVVVAICLAIWVVSGMGYFWPAWVIVIGGFKLAARARDTFGGDRTYADLDA
jgi:hypothetical protein